MATLTDQFEKCDIKQDLQTEKLEHIKSIALKMLQDGMCCSAIAKYTGLSKEEVKNLDNAHKCDH